MCKVLIAGRAYRLMQIELSRYPNVETGGVLLGYYDEENCLLQVLEATDGGQQAVREAGAFMYDTEYVQHVAGLLAELYQPPLQVIGVWHKHNHAYEPPFSEADKCMHRELLQSMEARGVSILFQKIEEEQYRMGTFWLEVPDICREVEFVLDE